MFFYYKKSACARKPTKDLFTKSSPRILRTKTRLPIYAVAVRIDIIKSVYIEKILHSNNILSYPNIFVKRFAALFAAEKSLLLKSKTNKILKCGKSFQNTR